MSEKSIHNNAVRLRLAELRRLMKERGYDAVIIPTGDYHMSEYTGDHFKCREFITGFTGSAGTAVIFRDDPVLSNPKYTEQAEAVSKAADDDFSAPDIDEIEILSGLWTDSRYYIQAEQQLAGTGIRLFKLGQPGTSGITNHLISNLSEGSRVACDGRVISFDTFAEWYDALENAGIQLDEQVDLIGELWEDRPSLPDSPAFEYDVKYAGQSRCDKLNHLKQKITDKGASAHLLTCLDDIAWLLNIRASDVHCNPVLLSYFLMERVSDQESSGDNYETISTGPPDSAASANQPNWRMRLFASEKSVGEELKEALTSDGITLEPYDAIESALKELDTSDILLSATETNSYLYGLIPPAVYIIEDDNPTQMMKAVKNPVEADNARRAHLKDGVALTKFMYWLKSSVSQVDSSTDADFVAKQSITGDRPISELSAAKKLFELRSEQENFMGNSFDPIIAYAEHAAIVHYSATEETDRTLENKGLVLCDTGGHYLEGTTDVTRTIALGPLTDDELRMSTAVLRGHIALAGAVFPHGLNGGNLDYLAHAPLWELGKDYGHGTGHGVGHFLNVHEGPNYIHWTRNGNTGTTPPFEPGMITSCEPGYYEEGKFGVRHESLLLCKPFKADPPETEGFADESANGFTEEAETKSRNENLMVSMLCFEELTMVPFDLDAIDISLLDDREKEFLNSYHKRIYESVSPFLTNDEREWLGNACRPFDCWDI